MYIHYTIDSVLMMTIYGKLKKVTQDVLIINKVEPEANRN